MASRIVKQPNGKYAAFADPVDHFVAFDASREEILRFSMDHWGCTTQEAEAKLERAEEDLTMDGEKGRFEESINTIRIIHGQHEADRYRKMLSTP